MAKQGENNHIGCIPVDVSIALKQYAKDHGRTWKSQLVNEWMEGSDTLRYVRNTIGPSGLYRLKLL
jgi:hypothetical protein